jgi:hypothetical protein
MPTVNIVIRCDKISLHGYIKLFSLPHISILTVRHGDVVITTEDVDLLWYQFYISHNCYLTCSLVHRISLLHPSILHPRLPCPQSTYAYYSSPYLPKARLGAQGPQDPPCCKRLTHNANAYSHSIRHTLAQICETECFSEAQTYVNSGV